MKLLFCTSIALVIVAAVACNKAEYPYSYSNTTCLHAIVREIHNLDCGYPLLAFTEDSAVVHAVTGSNDTLYIAKYLPDSLNVAGKKLCVTVEELKPEEEFPCRALGPAYPHLKIVSAKAIE